jgi:pyruvate dehydrogenase E2 component (dihydrolipoamide acetyltransferase)
LAHELKMPALSPTMEKGTLARWLVGVGDRVKPGDLLAEIETDKATMEFEAIDEGVVSALLVAGGSENVLVGTVIATLGEAGEAAPAPSSAPTAAPGGAPEPTLLAAPVAAPAKAEGVNATPLVRRIADARHIALDRIRGSGARGKIVKADLGLPAVVPVVGSPAPAAAPVAIVHAPPAGVPVETVKLSGMRKTIARRLTEAKQTVPHFYLTVRCQLDALLKLRGEINHSLAARGIKLSVNDFLIKAMASAMAQVPDVNVQFGGDELHRFGRVDIAMAVAIDGGLVTPVIRDVGALSLSAIARQSQTLAEQARAGKLKPEDYQGGTASISNLGMYGIDEMIPVINPPQALILGIGAGVEQPWQVDGKIGLATILAATASFDHRAIDGAAAAQFMSALRQLIENPLLLVS